MRFTKHTFPIRMIDAAPNPIEIVSGWRLGEIGFHRSSNGKAWIASDLMSGMRICTGATRKECAAWCEENAQKIEDRKLEPFYIQRVMEFRDLLRKELENLE